MLTRVILSAGIAIALASPILAQDGAQDTSDAKPESETRSANPAKDAKADSKDQKSAADGQGKQSTEDQQNAGTSEPVLVVTQYVVATETGCWATFYDGENYTGNYLTLSGRYQLPEVEFDLKPYTLGGDPDSVVVGPNATLQLYGDEEYEDKEHDLKADSRVANLSTTPFWDNIESVKLKCNAATNTAE